MEFLDVYNFLLGQFNSLNDFCDNRTFLSSSMATIIMRNTDPLLFVIGQCLLLLLCNVSMYCMEKIVKITQKLYEKGPYVSHHQNCSKQNSCEEITYTGLTHYCLMPTIFTD